MRLRKNVWRSIQLDSDLRTEMLGADLVKTGKDNFDLEGQRDLYHH